MNIIFFEGNIRDHLLPLTFTRPVSEIRIGILTIREKWERILKEKTSHFTIDYLSAKYPANPGDDNIFILGGLLPGPEVIDKVSGLKLNESLYEGDEILAFRTGISGARDFMNGKQLALKKIQLSENISIIKYPWQIFSMNGEQIGFDFQLLTRNRKSASLSPTNRILGNNIFIEEGARIEMAMINTETGPVYIGKDSEIMEGTIIRGPFALCEGSALKLGTKIYGPTTIGPYSKAGGEINNSVILGYSNKGHDGFLGNSVIGEWCNIGADSNNSNLKNNYAEVRLWSYPEGKFVSTGLQFCGLIMGDHSKCGINTMFNTGTVVGVNANIFGSGFPRNFIPSFSWGGSQGFIVYKIEKALEVAEKVMARRGIELDDTEKNILNEVYKLTEKYRK